MELKLSIYGCLCATSVFLINGIDADYDDFGEKYDRNPDEAEPYGCGDMQFTMIEATAEVLNKYKITEDEYNEIALELEDKLSFGGCGLCV